ncbi:cellulose biosynthesis cyclic di-GMP-binding regulatory protein BcsB [Alkalinema pantanalense CENA528]|uniref:cellulose biosynthesis cyclic di-GMP-binding regulatory protein BcsB n=1 Tax=Alkalinema pantanalense TaxID=1620705 RepID=UPI003D6E8209
MKKRHPNLSPTQQRSSSRRFRFVKPRWTPLMLRSCLLGGLSLLTGLVVLLSHSDPGGIALSQGIQQQEDQVIRNYKLPSAPPPAPVYQPAPDPAPAQPAPERAPVESRPIEPAPAQPDASDKPESDKPTDTTKDKLEDDTSATEVASLSGLNRYVLEFNRSPAIGNRFRLQGVYAESRLGFTRPRTWQIKTAKVLVRFRHSPDLAAGKSNLIVRVNDTSVGSIPLNLKQAQIGESIVEIPANLLQDYNEITLVAQQQNTSNCSSAQDDKLWTEVLPDSKVVMDYQTKGFPLDFSRYPYPFFDNLALDTAKINYLMPAQTNPEWLQAASRFHSYMGRLADFRPMETTLVKEAKNFQWNDRLVIIGTPDEQPLLKSLKLPLAISGKQFLQADKAPLPDDVGILALSTLKNGSVPVLVISGNSPAGVTKAAQFLVQAQDSQIGTGQFILVTSDQVPEITSPAVRDWPKYLPGRSQFNLSDLRGNDGKAFQDVTVRGSSAPRIDFDFRALPDDRFIRGSTMTVRYSYSGQVDTSKSTISVVVDGIGIGSKKLSNDNGASQETFVVDLPADLITSTSKIGVDFRLVPKAPEQCGQITDQQLWGTLHKDSSFNLNREISVQLPDLKLFTTGYPFAAPQDLSRMAIVLPDKPSETEVMTLLKLSERMGRISQAKSARQEVYTTSKLQDSTKKFKHLVGIGTRDRFPLPEVFQEKDGFKLLDGLTRQFKQTQIQTLPDTGGVVQTVLSPWNSDRVILALTAQTEGGLKQVQDVLNNDSWFYQLQDDTAIISANPNTSPYDSNGYQFQFFRQSEQRSLENLNPISRMRRVFQNNWWLLPSGIIGLSILLYGIAQLYLKRVAGESP